MATAMGPPMSVRALTSGDGRTIEFAISGRIDPGDVPRLCDEVCAHLQASAPVRVICDLGGVVTSDAVAVEALARLQLAAGRRGCRVALRKASKELLDLLLLVGLDGVVPVADA